MPVFASKLIADLGDGVVLAPERYDPRREQLGGKGNDDAVVLSSLVQLIHKTLNAGSGETEKCIVFDTSNSREGIVSGVNPPIETSRIGSTKKIIEPCDVIISRLRPYLRQVAFVDDKIPYLSQGTLLVCSTEYYVLRSMNKESIAFLVPFLLCRPVQAVLAAAQEGGHHPRFGEDTLLSLPVPASVLQRRKQLSDQVVESVLAYRKSEISLAQSIKVVESFFD